MEEIATAENILCGVGAKAKMCTCAHRVLVLMIKLKCLLHVADVQVPVKFK